MAATNKIRVTAVLSAILKPALPAVIAVGILVAQPTAAGAQPRAPDVTDRVLSAVAITLGDGSAPPQAKLRAILAGSDSDAGLLTASERRHRAATRRAFAHAFLSFGEMAEARRQAELAMAILSHTRSDDPGWWRARAASHRTLGDTLAQQSAGDDFVVGDRLTSGGGSGEPVRPIGMAPGRRPSGATPSPDLAAALAQYHESLKILERLAASAPGDPAIARDLFLAQEKLGDALMEMSDGGGALAAFRQGLAVAERQLAVNPADREWRRGVTAALIKVGDGLLWRDDAKAAREEYQRALQLAQALARETNFSDAVALHDLAVAQTAVGEALERLSRFADALMVFQQAASLRQDLVTLEPGNVMWRRNLVGSQAWVGDMLRKSGDVPGAVRMLEQSQALREALSAAEPDNLLLTRLVAVGHAKLGHTLLDMGQHPEALASYRRAVAVIERTIAAQPESWLARQDLYLTRVYVGDAQGRTGATGDALATYRKALADVRNLPPEQAGTLFWRRNLARTQFKVGSTLFLLRKNAEALEVLAPLKPVVADLVKTDPRRGEWVETQKTLAMTLAVLEMQKR